MTTYNTGNPVGSIDARDLLDNAQALDEAMNSTGSTWTDRRGVTRKTFKAAENAADQAEAAANTAVNTTIPGYVAAVEARKNTAINSEIPAAVALVDTAVAETAAGAASAAKAAAEAARDASVVNARLYATTAAGLAGTTSGQAFLVTTSDPQKFSVYSNSGGSAALVGTLNMVDGRLLTGVQAVPGYAYVVEDGKGKMAFGIKSDGTLKAMYVEAGAVTATTLGASAVADIEQAVLDSAIYDHINSGAYAYLLKDAKGRVALGIRTDGTVDIGVADVKQLTSAGSFARYAGAYLHQVNYISNSGQSNAAGASEADITTAQEYDNVGFPSLNASPTEFLPLTLANTRNAGGTYKESPLYGGLGFAKDRILNENGVSYTINDYLLVGANNAVGNTAIADLSKGTTSYNATIGQVQAAYNIAAAQGKSMAFPAVFWTQGESDGALATGAYYTALKQLWSDYNTDGIAITGQNQPVHLISWQTTSSARNTALETLQLANENPAVHVAAPAYIFTYADLVHINAASAKWLGGYYGLVYKKVVIDREKWEPLQPIGHAVNGSVVDLIFNKTGLVFDTTTVPAQTNMGFSLTDAGAVTLSSVAIVAPNRVRFTLSAPPPVGAQIKYAANSATGKSPYTGGAGNLRDSQGDTITYAAISKRMDNWCVIFNYTL